MPDKEYPLKARIVFNDTYRNGRLKEVDVVLLYRGYQAGILTYLSKEDYLSLVDDKNLSFDNRLELAVDDTVLVDLESKAKHNRERKRGSGGHSASA